MVRDMVRARRLPEKSKRLTGRAYFEARSGEDGAALLEARIRPHRTPDPAAPHPGSCVILPEPYVILCDSA